MLGKNIVKFRKYSKLSQEELAELMQVSRQTISNWELGETSPTAEQVIELSKIFKISADELLGMDIKDTVIEKVNGTEKLVKKQIKFTKILFLTIYVLVLIILLGIGIYFFTLKDFTSTYQDGFTCRINNSRYSIMLSPGEYNSFNEETNNFEVTDNGLWRMHVVEYDKEGNVVMSDVGFGAGYSYKEAMDSLNLVKKKIISRGGTCK